MEARLQTPPNFHCKLADYFLAAQGFFAAQGLAAQGLASVLLLLAAALVLVLLFSAFLSVAAQGFFAAHGFLPAQGFAWAKVTAGDSKNAAATRANTKRMNLCFIESSSIAANCGFVTLKTKLGE